MSSKIFRLLALFVVLAMVLAPLSSKPALAVTGPATDEVVAGSSPESPASTKGVVGGTSETGIYIVQLADASLAAYKGGIAGLVATSPEATGARKLDVTTPASQAYLSFLGTQQSNFLAAAQSTLGRSIEVSYQYRNVLNAVALQVSLDEAVSLSKLAGVKTVFADRLNQPATDVGPTWIGAAAIWSGDTGSGVDTRGEGVIIGMIDSGINHAHPSFADVGGDLYDHTNPYSSGVYVGYCVANPSFCNDKLIGAYDLYPGGSGGPEDTAGHGSHTASTAGGNVHEADYMGYIRTISGVAPHANLIAYKVCNPSCPESSSVMAVDYAIDNGADVLNYSISGGDDPWNDPVDLAFLDAYAAGIFVSASAGNAGPGAATVAHTGPWNASVGASTHTRIFANTFDITAPAPVPSELVGLAAVQGTGPALGADLAAGIAYDPANLNGCNPFSAGYFAGKFALIQRGTCSFAIKVGNAQTAGAVGVITFNNAGGPPIVMGGLEATLIPSAMLGLGDGLAVQAWIDTNPTTAAGQLYEAVNVVENPDFADIMGSFSSRGPSDFDVLKPDYVAPGVNILAAVAAVGSDPVQYDLYQGTSMAAPHGAGSAALMVALHPDWSPGAVKSAMASSSVTQGILKENAITPADPHDMGSGRLWLADAATVGLVWDETSANFVAADPTMGGDPKTLNLSTMTTHACVGTCTWTRTVTSVLPFPATYTASFTSSTGVVGTVTPDMFTIPAGGTQELVITADVTALPLDAWVFGYVHLETDAVWGGGGTADVVWSQDFNSATFPPAGWAVADNEGAGLVWTNLAGCGETGNFTGGSGDVACFSSDVAPGEFDTELWTPAFSLEGYLTANVTYLANYQNFANLDYLDLDISTDGGATWTTLLSWNEDHGTFRDTPGVSVDISLNDYVGQASVILRWHYYDPNTDDYDWYAQVDDVTVNGFTEAGAPVAAQHMTLSAVPAAANIPDLVTIVTNNKSGTQMVTGIQVAEDITDLTIAVDGMDQATLYKPMVAEGDVYEITFEVPDGALRLVAQVMESTSLDVDMYVGTGSTTLCTSASGAVLEYCNLDNPVAGTYWIDIENFTGSGDPTDLIATAVGTVMPGDAGNLTVTGPATVPGGQLFDLEASWNNPDLVDEDVYYGVFSVGTDPANPGNLGSVNVNFSYTQQIFLTKTGPETAQTGDVVEYSLVMQGNEPIQYPAWLTDTLPAGVAFAGGLTASYGTATYDETDNAVYWSTDMTAGGTPGGSVAGNRSRTVSLSLDAAPASGTAAAAPVPPDAAVALVLDDGTPENNIGIGGTWEFIFLNRFTPAASEFPFALNQVQVYFDSSGLAQVGDEIVLAIYENTTGGYDPAVGSNLLATFPATVQAIDSWNVYDLAAPVDFNGPGDVLVGVIALEVPGTSYWPAAMDQTTTQQRSWAGWWLTAPPPTPPTLPPDDSWTLIDAYFPGNWLIRGYGETTTVYPEVITVTFNVTVTAEVGDVTNMAYLIYDGDPFMAETTLTLPEPEMAYLQVAHLAPFAADPGTVVTVTLNGVPALIDFAYGDSTGYIPLPAGTYDVAVWPMGAVEPAITATVDLMDDMYYTAVAIGDGVNQDLSLLALVDDMTAPAAGSFKLRIGHLAPFASGGATADVRLQDGTVILNDVDFSDVAAYLELPAGTYDLKITTPDGATTLIDPLPVDFVEGMILSAFATGEVVNQPLGVFALPAGVEGFFLPLYVEEEDEFFNFLPLIWKVPAE